MWCYHPNACPENITVSPNAEDQTEDDTQEDVLIDCWYPPENNLGECTGPTKEKMSKCNYREKTTCDNRASIKDKCWVPYVIGIILSEESEEKMIYSCKVSDIDKAVYTDCTKRSFTYNSFLECIQKTSGTGCYVPSISSLNKCTYQEEGCYDSSSGLLTESAYNKKDICEKNLVALAQDRSLKNEDKCDARRCFCNGQIIGEGQCCGGVWTYELTLSGAPKSECTKSDAITSTRHYECTEDDCKAHRGSVILKQLEEIDSGFQKAFDEERQKVCVRQYEGSNAVFMEWHDIDNEFGWKDKIFEDVEVCVQNNDEKGNSFLLVPKAHAQSENSEESLENHPFISYYPEDGIYEVTDGKGRTASAIGGSGGYVYYEERNGIEGFQSPEDPQNPKDNEDLIVPRSSLVKVEKVASFIDLSLKKGINIISFNLLPSVGGVDSKLTYADFLAIANRKGENVSRIATFKGGQWEGGAVYNFDTKEIKGQKEEVLTMGKGYLVMAEKDTTISVPGYAIQSPIPIAFSSGWNLIGVHGHDTQYTAKSLINSVNSIEGLKANNVTYWPTSKGMYQGFQLSEGQEYGQDFPISKDLGYFIRINEFNPKQSGCKSILWNPGGQRNGECGTDLN